MTSPVRNLRFAWFPLAAGGKYNAFLAKTNGNGVLQWSHTYECTSYNGAKFVQQTSDGGYIMAGESDDCMISLRKVNSQGAVEREKKFDLSRGISVQQTSDGGFVFSGSNSIGTANPVAYRGKTNGQGVLQWSRTYGTGRAESIRQTPDGGYIMTGELNGKHPLIKTDSNGMVD